jgi:tetratricopeptide (TPR) repeat protein
MLLKWFQASDATQVGTALADDFVLHSAPGTAGSRKADNPHAQGQELRKFLGKFLQRVDRETHPLKLNLFKRAKLANSFKWRLLEKGVEQPLVQELTQALVLRLTSNQGAAVPSGAGASGTKHRSRSRETQALHTRGYDLLTRGRYAEALECYEELVNLDARDAVARNALGTALAQLARYDEAEQQFRRAIGIRPNFPEAYFNLAGVLQMTGRWSELEVPLRRALKLKPSYIDARVGLGNGFVVQGRLEEARDCYEKVLRLAPRNVLSLVGMGQIDALQGRFAEAEATYRAALEVDPASSYAWAGLVWLRKMTPADGAWLKRAEEIADKDLTPVDEATLRFAIGKYCDDVGDFARAFRNYQRANELHKMRAAPYNREARARLVDDLMRVYTPEALARARAGGSGSARPVFVVGMPRSGTSLVEQIIASHPAATGAGELHFWTVVARNHERVIRQEVLAEPLRKKVAAEYLRVLAGHSADALRVIDKAPYNSDYLGLIHSVYPNARMIYVRRDPIDTCLSCYFQQFAPVMNYTMDLSDLAHYYREHRRLVAHWRGVLPPQSLLEVPYAELVADQEKWTRRILEFLGLPWDERCLDFHKTARAVTTASTWQVRQRIYKSSVERWRNYKKFIAPLLELSDLEA